MSFAKFKTTLGGKHFVFEKDKKYEILAEDDDYYYIRQPDSPKNKNWVCKFPKSIEGNMYEVIE